MMSKRMLSGFAVRWMSVSLALSGIAGCELFPQDGNPPGGDPSTMQPTEAPPPSFNIDGQWRHAGAGTLRDTCITVSQNRIVQLDDGCNGNVLILASAPRADMQVGTQIIRIFTSFIVSNDDPATGGAYTYTLEPGPNGTLVGSGIMRPFPSGEILTGQVTWVKQ